MDTIRRISCAFTGLNRTYYHDQSLDYFTGIEYAKQHQLDEANIDVRLKHIYNVLTLPSAKNTDYAFLSFVVCVAVELEREDLIETPQVELSDFALALNEHVGIRESRIKINNQHHSLNTYIDYHIVGPLVTFSPDIFDSAFRILRKMTLSGELNNPNNVGILTLIHSILRHSSSIIRESAEAFLGRSFDDIPFNDMDCSLQTNSFDVDELQSLVHSLLPLYRKAA